VIEVFGELGLRRAGSTAIDAGRLLSVAAGQDAQAAGVRHALGQAIGGVLAAVVALADPGLVIVGGSWGRHPAVMEVISSAFARLPRHVPVRAAALTDQPSLAGARSDAVRRLRSAIVAAAHPPHPG
jgi:predicted NBD/HSP70 family sugar kinase